MIETIRNRIEEIVEQACAADTNIFGYDIWTHHILKVVENTKRLTPLFDADPRNCGTCGRCSTITPASRDKAFYKDHHIHGPIEAEKLLKRFGYPKQKTEAVKDAIATHRASVTVEHRSAEGACLANADAMSHIETSPLAFILGLCSSPNGN